MANYTHNYGSTAGSWIPVVVHWDSSGLDLNYNGNNLATNLATPGFVPSPGDTFAFSGRTGGANQNTYLDDISISTTPTSPLTTGGPVITEFVADNNDTLEDEDLDSPDWLEIYNGQVASVNLSGYYLTNDMANKTMWQFPSVPMLGFEYITVFASGEESRFGRSPVAYEFHPREKWRLPRASRTGRQYGSHRVQLRASD